MLPNNAPDAHKTRRRNIIKRILLVCVLLAAAGLALLAGSVLVRQTIPSAALGVAGMSCLWSILELKEQEKRVARGWFPKKERKKST